MIEDARLQARMWEYIAYLQDHRAVAEAIGFNGADLYDRRTWPPEALQTLQDSIVSLEATNGSLPPPPPRPGESSSPADRARHERLLNARKIAFSLWLEMNGRVPWRLHSLPYPSLPALLSFDRAFPIGVSDDFLRLVESPDVAFRKATELGILAPGATRLGTIDSLIRWEGDHIGHRSWDSASGSYSEPVPTSVSGFFDPPVAGTTHRHIGACHLTGDFTCVMSASLNIPCATRGYPAGSGDSGGHRYVDFAADDRIMEHGDNPYSESGRPILLRGERRVLLLDAVARRHECVTVARHAIDIAPIRACLGI